MNSKKAKLLRKLTKFDPKEKRTYTPLITQDRNGKSMEIETTNVSTGVRKDYQILKKWCEGKDVILPNHLKDLVE